MKYAGVLERLWSRSQRKYECSAIMRSAGGWVSWIVPKRPGLPTYPKACHLGTKRHFTDLLGHENLTCRENGLQRLTREWIAVCIFSRRMKSNCRVPKKTQVWRKGIPSMKGWTTIGTEDQLTDWNNLESERTSYTVQSIKDLQSKRAAKIK